MLVPLQNNVLHRPMPVIPSSVENTNSPVPDYDVLLTLVGKKQDRSAFKQIFAYFAPRVKSYILKLGTSEELAEDIVQNTMVTLWQKASTFDPSKARASTWIFTIARNKRTDALRTLNRTGVTISPEDIEKKLGDEDAPNMEDRFSSAQDAKIVRNALKSIPKDQLDLLKMAYFQEKTHQDIADETDIPLGTVKSRIRLGLDKLKKSLEGMER